MKPLPPQAYWLALPVVGALLPLWLWYAYSVAPLLTTPEKELLAFRPVTARLSRPVARTAAGIKCPLPRKPPPSAAAAVVKGLAAVYPPVPLAALAPRSGGPAVKAEPAYRLSLVLFETGRRMAIVNGQVLREGDALGNYRVAIIEKNRVKLKGLKGELWVNLEQ